MHTIKKINTAVGIDDKLSLKKYLNYKSTLYSELFGLQNTNRKKEVVTSRRVFHPIAFIFLVLTAIKTYFMMHFMSDTPNYQ